MAPNNDTWVDDRLATLAPEPTWQADTARGLRHMRSARMRRKTPAWVFTAAGAAALGATLSAFPATRLFAERCVAACVAVLRNETPRAVPEPLRLGAMAPDFTRITASGSRLTLSELRGQVVLVNFWATWCPPCVREMPWFDEFQHTYKDFTVVGVSMDDDGWDAVRPFLTKAGELSVVWER